MRPGRSPCSHRSIWTSPLAGPQMWLRVTPYPSNDEVGTPKEQIPSGLFRCHGYYLKSELSGLAAKPAFGPLLGVYIVFLKDRVIVWLMGLEEMEGDSCEFMRSCCDCLSRAEFALHPPEEFTQIVVGMV